jgi:hypothetical protein
MILKWQELLNKDRNESNFWLSKVIMNSELKSEVIGKAKDKREFEIKLLIDNVEHDPIWINELIESIDVYIDKEAQIKANKLYQEAMRKGEILNEIIEEAKNKIAEEFNINIDDY